MVNPILCRSLSSCFPAAPTKGIPLRSSFAPGASPMKSNFASEFPFPNTRFVADALRGRDLFCQISCFNSNRRSAFDCMSLRRIFDLNSFLWWRV